MIIHKTEKGQTNRETDRRKCYNSVTVSYSALFGILTHDKDVNLTTNLRFYIYKAIT